MGAEARANAQMKAELHDKLVAFTTHVLDLIEEEADKSDIKFRRLSFIMDIDNGQGGGALATHGIGPATDEPADELVMHVKALQGLGARYGISNKTLAEAILGAELKLAPAPEPHSDRRRDVRDPRRAAARRPRGR